MHVDHVLPFYYAQALHIGVRFFLKSASLWWFNYLALACTSGCYLVFYCLLHLAGGEET